MRLLRLPLSTALPFLLVPLLLLHEAGADESAPGANPDAAALSPAQEALFDTPHLSNVTRPETLRYAYRQVGPGAFDDKIEVRVKEIHDNGTKDLAFDYLTGPHHVAFPEIGEFRGNPLLMLALDQDVADMNRALGISQAFLRNRIRDAFVAADVADGTVTLEGRDYPAMVVTIKPFARLERLDRISSMQEKSYAFTLCVVVPGMIARISIDTPADPALGAPALSKTITFQGEAP